MPVNNTFYIKKLEQFENCCVVFSALTNMPYVECDEESGNDCVFFFSNEEKAKAFAERYKDQKGIRLNVAKVPRAALKAFVAGLYGIGINIVMLEEDENIEIPLQMLAEKPAGDKNLGDKIPFINPELQLTALYFLQEARRKVIRSDEEKKRIRDMEEEMSVNFFRSRFIIAMDITTGTEVTVDGKKNYKLPMVKTNDGTAFVPVYTDVSEFKKMNARFKDMKFRLIPVPYQDLKKFIPAEGKGVVINPAGFNLVLRKEQLEKLQELYG